TSFLDSVHILPSLTSSSFDPLELLHGNMTIYIILPAWQMQAQARWLRLMISTLMRMIGTYGMRGGKECLFLLDEAGQLGHIPVIEDALTFLRYQGLRMLFIFQSIGQLESVFNKKQTVLLDNTEAIFFGTNSLEQAKRVSEMAGASTITVTSA